MPTVLKCKGCGGVLAEYSEIPYCSDDPYKTHPYPMYYVKLHNTLHGKCPFCGRELPKSHEFVDAIQVEVKPNPETLHKSPFTGAFHHDYHKEACSS